MPRPNAGPFTPAQVERIRQLYSEAIEEGFVRGMPDALVFAELILAEADTLTPCRADVDAAIVRPARGKGR